MKTLFPWQQAIVEKAKDQPFFLNGCKMGLGKTLTTVEELKAWLGPRDADDSWLTFRALIITPNAAKDVWATELESQMPGVPYVVLDPKNREASWAEFMSNGYGFLIVHWDVLGERSKTQPDGSRKKVPLMPQLRKMDWDWVVADEIHFASNRKASRTKGLKKLRARYKRALSGTPVRNKPDSFFSPLQWLDPKTWRSYWNFVDAYCLTKENVWGYMEIVGPKNEADLYAQIQSYSVFLEKKDVFDTVNTLPPQIIKVPWTHPQQLRAYKQMLSNDLAFIGHEEPGQPLAAPTILARLTRLRQFTAAYARIDDAGKVRLDEPSAKIDALIDIIQSTDEKVVVWTLSPQSCALINYRLNKLNIGAEQYHGEMSDAAKKMSKHIFIENADCRVFLATMQSGGTGMDGLQHVCSTQVFLDRSWATIDNDQAHDRLDRMGQTEPVHTIILQMVDSVDEVVEDRLELKQSWVRSMLHEQATKVGVDGLLTASTPTA